MMTELSFLGFSTIPFKGEAQFYHTFSVIQKQEAIYSQISLQKCGFVANTLNQWHESGTGLLMGCVQETFIIFGAEMKHFTFKENLTEMT